VDEAALTFNWALWGLLVLILGLTVIFPGRRRLWRFSIGPSRSVFIGLLLLQSAQMVNLYNSELHLHARWAPFLFFAGPSWFVLAIVMMGIRQRRAD